MTGLLPFLCLFMLVLATWPSALPLFLAYFTIGAGLAAFWNFAFSIHPTADKKYFKAVLLFTFYAWPVNVCMILTFGLLNLIKGK